MNVNIDILKDKTVLFVEDECIVHKEMKEILEVLFKSVYSAKNGEEALELYDLKQPDIVLTDIKMPRKDGISLVKKIRQENYEIPIIFLTSFNDLDLTLKAANLSVDGYLLKPIELDRLTVALCRAFQRVRSEIPKVIYLAEHLYYNMATHEVYKYGQLVVLGKKESLLLQFFIENRQRTLSNEEIVNHLWPFDYNSKSTLKNIILRLRNKLDSDLIISIRGIGYRLKIIES